jgi:hypothetical protein
LSTEESLQALEHGLTSSRDQAWQCCLRRDREFRCSICLELPGGNLHHPGSQEAEAMAWIVVQPENIGRRAVVDVGS